MIKLKRKINNDLHSTVQVKWNQVNYFLKPWAVFRTMLLGISFLGNLWVFRAFHRTPEAPDSFSQTFQWLPKEWHQTSAPVQVLPSILEVSVACGVIFYSPGKHRRSKTKLNILYSCEESLGFFWHTNILQVGFFNYTLKEHSSPLSRYASYTAVSVANQWWHERDWRVRQMNEITLTHGWLWHKCRPSLPG